MTAPFVSVDSESGFFLCFCGQGGLWARRPVLGIEQVP